MYNDFNSQLYADHPSEVMAEKKYISKFFYCFSLAYVISFALIMAGAGAVYFLAELSNMSEAGTNVIINAVSSLNTPLFFLILYLGIGRKNTSKHPVMSEITPAIFVMFIAIGMFFMIMGSVVGNAFSSFINIIMGSDSQNVVDVMISEMSIFEVTLYAVIMAPIFEELVFRKLIVDSFSKYGTAFCVCMSGFLFGAFHGNFYQFFYAFFVGCLFAFVYCVYGKIWHTILMHAILNFCGSVVPMLLGIADADVPELTLGFAVYIIVYLFVIIAGAVSFLVNRKKSKLYYISGVLVKPYRALFKSHGFIIALVIMIIMFVTSFFSL